jgi:hypothetical protein
MHTIQGDLSGIYYEPKVTHMIQQLELDYFYQTGPKML